MYPIASNKRSSSTGSDDGLAPVRRQAIIWTNHGLVQWRIYASLGLSELKLFIGTTEIVPRDGVCWMRRERQTGFRDM